MRKSLSARPIGMSAYRETFPDGPLGPESFTCRPAWAQRSRTSFSARPPSSRRARDRRSPPTRRCGNGSPRGPAFETALVIAFIALFLEVIHYRNAVLEANVDRGRAWKTVVELRKKCESVEPKRDGK